MDLDEDELKATKRLYKIDEDIKRLKYLVKVCKEKCNGDIDNLYLNLWDIAFKPQSLENVLNRLEKLEEEKRHTKYLLNDRKFYSEWYLEEIIMCDEIEELLKGD